MGSRTEDGGAGAVRPHPPAGLYVHVPFCLSLCPYCEFVVVAGRAARSAVDRAAFTAALRVEISLRADLLDGFLGPPDIGGGGRRPPLDTVYFGGGTPTLLAIDDLAGLLDLIRARYGLAVDAELTIEANPGPGERGDAAALRALGFTRLSIGAQSLAPEELRRLGRRHLPADVVGAVAQARAAGIPSIALDLLYDIPGQSLASWVETLETALEIGPDHLSLYALTLGDPDAEGLTGIFGDHLPTPAGARRWRERARAAQDEDRAAAQYHYAANRLADEGWRGYEISNWARPGHESRHNLAYWERRPYEAVGPGAHAFDGATRRWNAARLDGYVGALVPDTGPPTLPPGGVESLDAASAAAEELILGLRTDRGVDREAFAGDGRPAALAWAMANGLLEDGRDGRIRLTTAGCLLSNELFARLV
jgi:oxygen-independent coproporphyrinogen-3 oxidase